MKPLIVTKRNGTKQEFDTKKIKQSIAFACNDVDVNPNELESKIDLFVKNGITTSDIQINIIQHAQQLASYDAPQWLKVAGNAFAMNEWNSFKLKTKTLKEIIQYNISKDEYKKTLSDYSDEDFKIIESYLDHNIDLQHSVASLITAKKKYLGKFELNQHMHLVNAMVFAQNEPKDIRLSIIKKYYEVLSKREFSLATPFLSNLRSGGNLASCFILALEDDLDSIFNNIHRIAKVSKNGGGLGIFMGYLRAKGSKVKGVDNAAGSIVQWVKIINDTLVAVNQGGKRSGAGTVALPLWHNDIYDFLDMQTEHGDIRLKAYDVFPQVTANDIFMERDKNQQQWVTFCPFEVKEVLGIDVRGLHGERFTEAYLKIEQAVVAGKLKVCKVIPNARDLTKIIMRNNFETGLPYWAFTDTMNRENPNKNDLESYGILCANLCVESFSNIKPDVYSHVCNLGSINMGNIYDLDRLAEVSRIACRMLNAGVDLTKHPDPTTEAHNNRYRTIGIGVMGLHDYLAREFKSWSELDHIQNIFECIEFNAAIQSSELAKKRGSFGAFVDSGWASGEMTRKFKSRSLGLYDWDSLQEKINIYGMLNSQLTSPAPTTTTSIYQDASSSVLPIFASFFSEDNKNGSLKVSARYLKENPLGYGKTQSKFKAKELIDVVSRIQKFTDTGISMELLFNQNQENFSARDLYEAIHYAYKKELKTIYYIRSLKKNDVACESCAG